MNTRLAKSLYFTLQRLRREPVWRALGDVVQLEALSREELRAVQTRRMRALLLYAVDHVPYYRATLSALKGEIAKATSYERMFRVMSKVPPLEKGAIAGNEASFKSDEIKRIPTSPNVTSGSTGEPLMFPCDKLSWAYRHALQIRCLSWFGVNVGEPYGYFFGLHWSRRHRLSTAARDFVFNRLRVSAYAIQPSRILEYYFHLRSRGVTHFAGYPSAIYEFCVLANEPGISLRGLGLKAVFTTAEPLLPFQRAVIEEATGARCVNIYGSVEGGFNACECPAGRLHAMAESTWFQVDASTGQVLVTDVFLKAFPLINYAIGDEIDFAPDSEVCKCGRPHPIVSSVVGRSGEPIRLPNGRLVNANLPSYIFKPLAHLKRIRRYRFVEKPMGQLDLLLVVTQAFSRDDYAVVEKEVHKAFGPDINLEIRIVDRLPTLPNAKHRCYIKLSIKEAPMYEALEGKWPTRTVVR